MKSILAGAWPPLKPLPVFKYETAEYRATIDFDKKRGEWVCRKTALPSNEVQELRGGLREITLALPHGEAETPIGGPEQQEQEFEKDANRRLQAIREWREKFGNGARYSELRGFLSEGQRTELDDSLRHTLTARQLQFNSRNVADVFDDLSVAGGRFAALIELATRSKANQGIDAQPQGEGTGTIAEAAALYLAVPETERAANEDKQSPELSSRELEPVLNSTEPNDTEPNIIDAAVQNQEAEERNADANEFPALSIKNVFAEQDQAPLPERMAHAAFQQFETETFDIESDASDIAERDSSLPDEPPHLEDRHSHQEGRHSLLFTEFAAQTPVGQSFADRIAGASSRSPLRISAFQANVFALLFLFAVTSFTVGLTVGRGPLGKRLREAPKSLLAADAKPPTLPDQTDPYQADESSSQTPVPPLAGSDDSAGINMSGDSGPAEEKPKQGPLGSGNSAEVRSTDADSSPTTESKPIVIPEIVKPEVSSVRRSAIGPVIVPVPRKVSPPADTKLVRRPKVDSKAVRSIRRAPRSPAPHGLTSTIAAAPHVPRPSTILVNVPDSGSQPFRVSFPNKTIAATSSLAITSQLSVLVPSEPEPTVSHRSARLEAGELVSFGWPRYPSPGGRSAETIRVRATIGQLGQVLEVKFLGGSASLLPATMEAIRQWSYTPTVLDKKPVQAQQDITIEFRPPQYSARLSTQHPSHN